jgi:hypothetical protein
MKALPIDPPPIDLPDEITVDLLILPRKLAEDGDGLYDDSVLTLAKELRSEGVTADYLQPPEERRWIGEKSAVPLLVEFVIGVGGNAGWAALKALFGRRPADKTRVRLARAKSCGEKVEWEWFEAEGTGEEVVRAIEALEQSAAEGDGKDAGVTEDR